MALFLLRARLKNGPGGEIGKHKGLKIPRPNGLSGSSPLRGTTCHTHMGRLKIRRFVNSGRTGSIPVSGTMELVAKALLASRLPLLASMCSTG